MWANLCFGTRTSTAAFSVSYFELTLGLVLLQGFNFLKIKWTQYWRVFLFGLVTKSWKLHFKHFTLLYVVLLLPVWMFSNFMILSMTFASAVTNLIFPCTGLGEKFTQSPAFEQEVPTWRGCLGGLGNVALWVSYFKVHPLYFLLAVPIVRFLLSRLLILLPAEYSLQGRTRNP